MAAVLRAFFFYLFLVFVVRIVGRRPGKQITPFEFVLVFFMGGLALTAMVADDASLTNAFLQILTLAMAHYLVTQLRAHSSVAARFFDGTPLLLMKNQTWRADTMQRSGLQDNDVMDAARQQGVSSFDQIDEAILERNGEISISKIEQD